MANYESPRYLALGFYVDGVFRRFSSGHYSTDDPTEIAVLDALIDVRRVDENEPEEPQKDAEKAEKPAPKPRKASASSAK